MVFDQEVVGVVAGQSRTLIWPRKVDASRARGEQLAPDLPWQTDSPNTRDRGIVAAAGSNNSRNYLHKAMQQMTVFGVVRGIKTGDQPIRAIRESHLHDITTKLHVGTV